MAKNITILTTVCLCLMFGIEVRSYAAPKIITPEYKDQIMKRHIEKVKIKNPGKYQMMIQRAGGNVTDCIDCHQEVPKGKPGDKKGPGFGPDFGPSLKGIK